MVERRSPKPEVAGSIPVTPAIVRFDSKRDNMLRKFKAYRFFDQVWQEAGKVFWPEKKDLITSALVVILSVFVFSIVTMIFDYGIHAFIDFLLNVGKW